MVDLYIALRNTNGKPVQIFLDEEKNVIQYSIFSDGLIYSILGANETTDAAR